MKIKISYRRRICLWIWLSLLAQAGISKGQEIISQWPGHVRGDINVLAIDKGILLTGMKSSFLIAWDMTNPAEPVWLGDTMLSGVPEGLVIENDYTYVATRTGELWILDLGDAANPVTIGHCDVGGPAKGVAVANGFAYVTNETTGLDVVDVSDPSQPIVSGSFQTGETSTEVKVFGSYVYVLANGIHAVDVSDPTNPTLFKKSSGSFKGLAVTENYIYSSETLKLRTFTRISMTPGWTYNATGGSRKIAVAGNYAYYASSFSGLYIMDLSNPVLSVLAGKYTGSSVQGIRDVVLEDPYAYVLDGTSVVKALDVSTPSALELTGSINTTGTMNKVVVNGMYAYAADGDAGLQVFDISNPAQLIHIANHPTQGTANGLAVEGDYVYVVTPTSLRIHIFNVENPASPVLVGSRSVQGTVLDLTISNGLLYVSSSEGLEILDIQEPSNPVQKGNLTLKEISYQVAVSAGYAYVTKVGSGGLFIVDVNDPSAPQRVSEYPVTGNIFGVAADGDYAYLAADNSGLIILDIRDPEVPVYVNSYPGPAYNVFVHKGIAYVSIGSEGVVVLDVRDPHNITEMYRIDTNARVSQMIPVGGHAYMANGSLGLAVAQIPDMSGNVYPVFPFDLDQLNGADNGFLESWMGTIYWDIAFPAWIWSSHHGFIHIPGTDPENMYYWDTSLGFVWTSQSVYPWIYTNSDFHSGWLYYDENSTQPRYFWNGEQWLTD